MEFPIQSQRGAEPHPLKIPWSIAELAYSVYASRYGRSQSLERLAQRGGFGPNEMDDLLPGWRDKCVELLQLRARLKELRESHAAVWYALKEAADCFRALLKGKDCIHECDRERIELWQAQARAVLETENQTKFSPELAEHVTQ